MAVITHSAIIHGLSSTLIEVEINSVRGVPQLVLIGLASGAVDEAKERITSALQTFGIRIKSKRTIVNLAPADIRKTSAALDLAIAVGLLKVNQSITFETSSYAFFGELSLDGKIKTIAGVLPLVQTVKKLGFKHVVIPQGNHQEVETITGIEIHPLDSIGQLLEFARGHKQLPTLNHKPYQPQSVVLAETDLNFISGQTMAKRVLEISATGGHHLIFSGPPGMGKSMLAKALPAILPPLTEAEALAVTEIHSVLGLTQTGLITHRPFRSPHHTTSIIGLIGGGQSLRPGEISLAHYGVLFLDEVLEFPARVLNTLRQPLEEGKITLTKSSGSVTFPAAFTSVAAANPCPCGYWGSKIKICNCSPKRIADYQQRLAPPLRDRFDLHLTVDEVKINVLSSSTSNRESSVQVRQRVEAGFLRQQNRCHSHHIIFKQNGKLSSSELKQLCTLENTAQQLLERGAHSLGLSIRGYFKTLSVAQTIADIEGSNQILSSHIAEALQYRQPNLDT